MKWIKMANFGILENVSIWFKERKVKFDLGVERRPLEGNSTRATVPNRRKIGTDHYGDQDRSGGSLGSDRS